VSSSRVWSLPRCSKPSGTNCPFSPSQCATAEMGAPDWVGTMPNGREDLLDHLGGPHRHAVLRSWVIRVVPAMATSTPPPTAAISNAMPSGIDPANPRKRTFTCVEFCKTNTISRTKSSSAAAVATQAALGRVSREGHAPADVSAVGAVPRAVSDVPERSARSSRPQVPLAPRRD